METIRAEFCRLDELPLPLLIGAVGTYVIWDGKAQGRATYLGEGVILERFAKHASTFAWPFAGYAAITGDWTTDKAKGDAEIIEAVLLAVAAATDRLPTHNEAPGKVRRIHKIFRSHGTLRIRVTGWDPFLIPEQSRPLEPAKVATVRFVGDGSPYELTHDWRQRRRLLV